MLRNPIFSVNFQGGGGGGGSGPPVPPSGSAHAFVRVYNTCHFITTSYTFHQLVKLTCSNFKINLAINSANIFVQKMLSAYYFCCIYSNALQTNLIAESTNMNPLEHSAILLTCIKQ